MLGRQGNQELNEYVFTDVELLQTEIYVEFMEKRKR